MSLRGFSDLGARRRVRQNVPSLARCDVETVRRGFANGYGVRAALDVMWPHFETAPFVAGLHIDELCREVERVSNYDLGEDQDGLVVNYPPGHTKSTVVMGIWPASVWTQDPARRWIFASWAGHLLTRMGRNSVDRLLSSKWFRRRWPDAFVRPDVSFLDFSNASGGTRFSVTIGGMVTSTHCNHFVIDDPTKSQDAKGRRLAEPASLELARDFIVSTMPSRILPGGNWVINMQRLHEHDASEAALKTGRARHLRRPIRAEAKGTPCPVRVPHECVPDTRKKGAALWPEKMPEALIAKKEKGTASAAWVAQYDQRPAPVGGGVLKAHYFERHWAEPLRKRVAECDVVIQSWDMAFKGKESNDWVVGTVWGYRPGRLRLFDLVRGHWGLGQTIEQVLKLSKKWRMATTKLVEDAANGPAVVEILQSKLFGLELVDPKGGKLSRAHAAEPVFRSGNVELPPAHLAPWLQDYVDECVNFTGAPGATDDQVDSTTQAIVWFIEGNDDWLERLVDGTDDEGLEEDE